MVTDQAAGCEATLDEIAGVVPVAAEQDDSPVHDLRRQVCTRGINS